MLEAGIAVVGGNLGEPGAGHTATGRRRSLVLLNPDCSASNSSAGSRKTSNRYLPSCNPVSLTKVLASMKRVHVFVRYL